MQIKKRLLVTGATGKVGQAFIKRFLAEPKFEGWTVRALCHNRKLDKAPRLAQYFQAQSIPMVLAIFQGQLVSQFTGALPKREVERWLGEVFKRAGIELKKTVETEAPSEPEKAIAFWRQRLSQRSEDTKAKLALGKLLAAIVKLQGDGDYAGVKAFYARYAKLDPEAQAVIASMQGIPVDIQPIYPAKI